MHLVLPCLAEFALAFVATLGFGLLFNVPRRTLLPCGVVGGVGRMVRSIAVAAGASVAGGTYIGALAIAVLGYVLARKFESPRMVFTVTGVIPMIPGVPAFSTLLEFADGNVNVGMAYAVDTMLITGALAMGLTTVRVLSRVPNRSSDSV